GTRTNQGRTQRHRRTGIASHRLGDDVGFGKLRELLANLGFLRLIGDDENVFGRRERKHAFDSLLNKRAIPEQIQKLFWALFAADRPEPFATASCHNDYITVSGV